MQGEGMNKSGMRHLHYRSKENYSWRGSFANPVV